MTTFSAKFMSRYKPTFVYWHLGADGQVLYVGCTYRLHRRDRDHSRRSSWYPQVVAIGRSDAMPWREALKLERDMIFDLQPPHNIVHRRRAERLEASA